MLYLALTILTNGILFILFKLFHRYGIDNLQAIVVNYFTAAMLGIILSGRVPVLSGSISQPWFYWAVLMGCMFITIFNLIAWRTREDGITTTTIANKLSLVIPVLCSIWLYREDISALQITGILLAFPAVYLTAHIKGEDARPRSVFWPAIIFIGSGLLDTLVKYVEQSYLSDTPVQLAYTTHVFSSAFLLGVILVIIRRFTNHVPFHWRNVVAGVVLGIPNFFSIYLLIKFLHSGVFDSAAAIPVNNIGIVLFSSLVAIFFFQEKATPQRIFGLVLSVVSIILIALADLWMN